MHNASTDDESALNFFQWQLSVLHPKKSLAAIQTANEFQYKRQQSKQLSAIRETKNFHSRLLK